MARPLALFRGLPLLARLGLPIGLAVVSYLVVLKIELARAEARAVQLGLDKLALVARGDSTRHVDSLALVAIRTVYGDSLQGVQKLVVQEQQRTDALSRALKQVQVFAGSLQLQVAQLRTTLAGTATTEDSAGVRHGDFRVDSIRPYHVTAAVDLPRPPRLGVLRLGISQDPMPLRARLGCLPKNSDGLRPASLTLIAPEYATVRLDSLSQAPEVCNASPLQSHGRKVPAWLAGLVTIVAWIAGKTL
jgi:hypothetical protein